VVQVNVNKRPANSRRREAERPTSRFGLGFWVILAFILLLVAFVQVVAASRPQVDGTQLTYKRFVDLAEDGRIQTALILDADSYVTGTYRREDDRLARYNVRYLKNGTRENLLDVLIENNVDARIDQQFAKSLVTPAVALLPALMIVLVVAYVWLSIRRGTGLGSIRSGARRFRSSERSETFADVAGQEEAVEELREMTGALSEPKRFNELGARLPRGLLLYGPPGCGKTLLARAFAGETGASFFSISGSDFVELYYGVGAARVRDLFKEARENAPSVVFIDEIDAVGRSRVVGGASGEQEQALNQILTEMDGFLQAEGVIVLAATNRPDVLDPALLRPGRFDRSVGLERPSEDDRLAILSLHAKTRRLDPSVDLRQMAKRAYGMTGADLANVVNEAALLAARAHKSAISQVELERALDRAIQAPERQRRLSMRQPSIGRRAAGIDERVTFADVAGNDDAIEELTEVRDFLAEPERFADVGAQVPRGILLYGPPGCGKSLLARAMAGEAHGAFFSVSATEFVAGNIGAGAGRVRDLFAEAKAVAPAIVFIDEIDAIGGRRGGGRDSEDMSADSALRDQDQTLIQILAELDGFEPRTGVIVMAATNRPDMLDPALLRPGRFDRQVGISLPDRGGRQKILELHAKTRQLEPQVDLESIADRAHGMTGADLANVVNEAALLAARAHRKALAQAHFEEAVRRLVQAPERQRRLSMRQRSVGRRAAGIDERVTFAEVAGADDAIEELAEVRDFLAEPERFAEMGVRVPRGILLEGPPGCGKTLLAKAVAGEANAAFFSASGTEFVQRWVGLGAARMRDLFAEARAVAPAIVFIDEIDALGGRRGGPDADADSGRREQDQTLNQLLVELDGFEPRTGVIVMAATNRPDMLDPALLRPGRFDRQVGMALPDRGGRRAILELYVRGKPIAEDVDLDVVAGVTSGFSGAELANLVNEAGLLATRRRLPAITRDVMEEAIERVLVGVSSRRHLMTEEERRVVAYHEAGHALVGLTLPGVKVPHKVTIVPRGRLVGYVWSVDGEERAIHSRSALLNQMAVAFGGRTAEELVIGEPGSAAADDLAQVSALARRMVCELGMSEALGGVTYNGHATDDAGSARPSYSEAESRLIGEEVRRLIDDAHERSRQVLTDSREALDRLAQALLERETVTAEELEELVRPPVASV
jgi:ATP-dependent metalloprotease FtsH